MKLIFWIQINIKLFYKLMVSILVGKASHAQKTHLQYLKKSVIDDVDFCSR